MKKIIIGLCIMVSAVACKKIDDGFQSDYIRYKDNNIYAKRGLILFQSDRINADGSTPPYKYKMLNLRSEDGSALPAEFNTEYEITLFKPGMSFNAETDTTIELLNQKRETVKRLPMEFNETSGQLTFNRASANLPLGRYVFDVEMTNPTGTKLYPSLATINVVEPTSDDLFTITDNVSNAFHDVTGVATPMKNPTITCTKVSNEGARAILKMVDKNGRTFNPRAGEIIQRGDRPVFENYAKFNPVTLTDTAMICDFEIAPFPLTKYITPTTDWGFLMYYRIPSQFVTIDGFPSTLGAFSVNPRWSWQLKLEGTYVIQVKFSDVTKKG
ncbi:DUF5007 domain-containing protein [Mucilaginibacter sp. JRF]|uniref:DUF5007 domain-containing protein n=1 Tax=Mucilaginibacter sp. JRF TaxID=2780088 RepID=UPI00187FA9F2|nr:DUF5007 domain-containing protein [Mucilaginibacter sp. JRF]MBE9583583.1 DUF5007 domain-containing protein [Mucilaginibacter sp. JRF]